MLRALAPAKINVYLSITGRRPDGYHLLDSLMIPISLCDEVTIELENQKSKIKSQKSKTEKSDEERESRIVLTCDDPTIPADETNLAYKAAALLTRETGVEATISIRLHKRIPAGAGLGGGSSNAATVLKSLNILLSLGLSEERLCQFSARLGADVPFFIGCRPAHVEGIGEILTPVAPLPHRWIVLVVPPFSVSTPWAYRRFDELPPSIQSTPPPFRAGFGEWPAQEQFVNDLERAMLPEYPQIARIKASLLNLGAESALMSGSGSSVFGVFSGRSLAETATAMLMPYGRTFLTEPLTAPPTCS